MIEKIPSLPKIPFSETPSDDTQVKLKWIVNGEVLEGAKTKTDSGGNLNYAGVQIQKNVLQLDSNSEVTKDKVNEVVDQVNIIAENIKAISEENIIDIISRYEKEITELKTGVAANTAGVATNTSGIATIRGEIGVYDPALDPKNRTIRGDIIYLKSEIGAYAGFDINGGVDPDSTGSGLKHKVMTNAQAVSMQEARLAKLENEWNLSDVSVITEDVNGLRTEIGPKSLATPQPIYTRLVNLSNDNASTLAEVKAINEYVGRSGSAGNSLGDRMTSLENGLLSVSNQINLPTGIEYRLQQCEYNIGSLDDVGSMRYDISENKRSMMEFYEIIGEDSSEGVRGQVATIATDIGTDTEKTSIKGRVFLLEAGSRESNLAIQNLQSTVGNSSGGLVLSTQSLTKDMYGDSVSANYVERFGVKKVTQDLNTAVGVNTSGSQTGLYKMIADLTARVVALEAK